MSFKAGISDAAAGAGAGSFAGPYGTAIGAGLGFLTGMFSNDSKPQAPLFSDVNLATDNPTLYAQLQKQQAIIDQLQQAYSQREKGMTAEERNQYGQAMAQTGQALAHAGLSGTSQGMAQMENSSQNYQNQIAARILQQQMQLGGQLNSAQSGLTGAFQSGLQQTYGGQLVPYQQQIGEAGNQNSLYNGLFNGGMSLIGSNLNKDKYNQNTNNQSNGFLPNGYQMGPNGITFAGGQNPYGGGYVAPGTPMGQIPIQVMPQAQIGSYSFNPNSYGMNPSTYSVDPGQF